MLSQISKWGNSQGVRIPKKMLQIAGLEVDDQVEISTHSDGLIIKLLPKKTLDWYLEGYDTDDDRCSWGDGDNDGDPKGRELL